MDLGKLHILRARIYELGSATVLAGNLNLADDNWCFVCGRLNPIGLKLDFVDEGDEYVTYFTPSKEHQGWAGVTHGGIVSTLLDEVMARKIHVQGIKAVTGEIGVRFRKPALVGTRIRFAGKVLSESGRVIYTSGRATDEAGNVLAEATGKIVKVR